MAEFFVLRRYRRRGIGTRLTHLAFNRFPGAWQVRVMDSNAAAVRFWRKAIESFTGVSQSPTYSTIEGAHWWTFRFESRP
jgi:predicted acetyltransferase